MNVSSFPAKILIAPDKFKDSLTSLQVAQAIRRGARKAWPHAHLTLAPIADGGEGFVKTIVRAKNGKLHRIRTIDPVNKPCIALWGSIEDGKTAIIGLNEASGLERLKPSERNPLKTSSVGTGKIIEKALRSGCKTLIIGIGGSSTTEGGIGLAQAVGYRFIAKSGNPIELTGQGLENLYAILPPPSLPKCKFLVACDVDNPLYGKRGAAHCFARQKGASYDEMLRLDQNLKHLAGICKRDLGKSLHQTPGAGAAGGCGFGLMTFLHAEPLPGFTLIARILHLKKLIQTHDLIITGEGCLDRTSLAGKAPLAIARMTQSLHKPCWNISGKIDLSSSFQLPFAKKASLLTEKLTPEQCMRDASRLIEQRIRQLAQE